MINKTIRYLRNHSLRKTLARSFLEFSVIIDHEVLKHYATNVLIDSESDHVPFTGERVIPVYRNDCFYAHLSIYHFAQKFAQKKKVLDAGCGSGYGTHYLATHGAKDICGIDLAEDAVAFAREKYRGSNLRYVQIDCERMSFSRKVFEVVFSSNMIEHLNDYHAFLKGVSHVLTDDGIFILATPPLYGGEPVQDNLFHHTNLKVGEWIDILSTYFINIETFRHLLKTGKKNKKGDPYILDFANKPEDCNINEMDFYFEQVPIQLYRYRTETLTALFVASGKK